MCLYPQLIQNPKYKSTAKNNGIIPTINDQRVRYVPIGCQQCMECRKQKARAWQVRLLEDIKTNTNGKFITLTFNNKSIKNIIDGKDIDGKQIREPLTTKGYDLDNEIATIATRYFLERWRKKYKKSVRHWMITEIGHRGTENIHLHGIIWTNQTGQEIENIWKYGYVWKGHKKNHQIINYVNNQTVNYITKYVNKIDLHHKTYTPVILTSPGIGKNYTKTFNAKKNLYQANNTQETYRTTTGHTMSLPIYYRNKLYTDNERELLWIEKLNKNERWVDGQKIDISKGYKLYDIALKQAQQKNRDLGYLENDKKWKRAKYELERRKILQQTRIAQQ